MGFTRTKPQARKNGVRESRTALDGPGAIEGAENQVPRSTALIAAETRTQFSVSAPSCFRPGVVSW